MSMKTRALLALPGAAMVAVVAALACALPAGAAPTPTGASAGPAAPGMLAGPPPADTGAHRAAAVRPGVTYGPFNVRAQNSNKCLDVAGGPGSTADGALVQIWDCYGAGQTNQQWYFQDTGDPFVYNLIVRHSGKCLDVAGGPAAVDNGIRVQQWSCLGYFQTNQKWYLASYLQNGRTIYKLTAINSGKCLDSFGGPPAIDNGNPVGQWACVGDEFTNQRWYLTTP